jgi:hypothetical protein
MNKAAAAALLVMATIGLIATEALTVPEASDVPVTWEFDFEHGRPRPIQVKVPGKDKPQTFWYMMFTVGNSTGEEQTFAPEIVLYTDTGQVLRAGRKVPMKVFQAIREAHNDPLLKRLEDMTGKVLQGEDNSLDGVAIWPDFDPDAGAVDIFVGGLTDDKAEIKLPAPITVTESDGKGGEKQVTKDTIILSRTRQLSYKIPGEAASRFYTPAQLLRERWVMR